VGSEAVPVGGGEELVGETDDEEPAEDGDAEGCGTFDAGIALANYCMRGEKGKCWLT
jgi:hypothetical protein